MLDNQGPVQTLVSSKNFVTNNHIHVDRLEFFNVRIEHDNFNASAREQALVFGKFVPVTRNEVHRLCRRRHSDLLIACRNSCKPTPRFKGSSKTVSIWCDCNISRIFGSLKLYPMKTTTF